MKHLADPLLLVHTSAALGLVAVARGESVVHEELDRRDPQVRTVAAAVQGLLARQGMQVADLEGVVVTTGPGSFTGIRVGLATAQGLATARGWDVHCCDSLLPEAAAVDSADLPVAVVLDARRGEVYAGLYDVRGAVPRPVVPLFCAGPGAAAARLRAGLDAGTAVGVVGTGADSVCAAWGRAIASRVLQPPPEARARALLRLAQRGGCRRLAPADLEPQYVRLPDVVLPGGGR
jgi:tRNA threonylcarbamoyladenosine biosynthesis protein TsaB